MAIFTAGAMGSGKSHFVRMLSRYGLFPLDDFLYIDPDKIKGMLPETDVYNSNNPLTASTLVHQESTHIADLLFRYGIENDVNMIIDGTLSDYDFFGTIFDDMKQRGFMIVLLHVHCDLKTAINRCRKRSLDTKRVITNDIVTSSWNNSRKSYEMLVHKSDYSFEINTNGEVPIIKGGFHHFVSLFGSQNEAKIKCLDDGYWPES